MATSKKNEKTTRPSAKQLREMSVEELSKKLSEESEELMRARFKHAAAALEKTSEIKGMRRQIARFSTVLNEKKVKA